MGYITGGFVFVFLIPYGLFRFAGAIDCLNYIQILPLFTFRYIIVFIIGVCGLSMAVWSIVIQNIEGEGGPLEGAGIEISPGTRHLVVSGPYKYTRNPMLFGACVYYLAAAVFLNSVFALILVVLFTAVMLTFVKFTEEPRLLKDFDSEYKDYRNKVPMFIPWPGKNKGE